MENETKGKAIIGICILLAIATGIFLFYPRDTPQSNSDISVQVQKWQIQDEDYSYLNIHPLTETAQESEVCYDLFYYPDESQAGNFVREYYKIIPNIPNHNFFGAKFIGNYKSNEFKLYRTNGTDKVVIDFYDGTNKSYDLYKTQVMHINIKISNNSFKAVYGCYFDGVLRASDLTYDELRSHVCDDYKRICLR
jgi:hypothetical protein